MRFPSLVAAMAVGVAAYGYASDSSACGGCVVPTEERDLTQVSAHRMALSISPERTTLWDQIQYTGAPESFAWILPIKGQVEVAVSSDLLFEALTSMTQIQIFGPPPPQCAPPPYCGGTATGTGTGTGTGSGTSIGTSTSTGVGIIANEVVGPFETVQLESDDPTALTDWLDGHGYEVPPDVAPIIAAYINEGFDFLAVRLVPGQGIDAMQPLRISSPGASMTLPLRMVAAGTGSLTSIRLWMVGEGRYEPTNASTFEIPESDIVWDWSTSSSNYAVLKEQGFAQTGNLGWLVSASISASQAGLSSIVQTGINGDGSSGYGPDYSAEVQGAVNDVNYLTGDHNPGDLRITRLDADLGRAAFQNDLLVGASTDQSQISPQKFVTNSINQPVCPEYPPCPDTNTSTSTDTSTNTDMNDVLNLDGEGLGESSCQMGKGGGVSAGLLLGAAWLMASLRRQRRQRQPQRPQH